MQVYSRDSSVMTPYGAIISFIDEYYVHIDPMVVADRP
jgi:hypothetical protein